MIDAHQLFWHGRRAAHERSGWTRRRRRRWLAGAPAAGRTSTACQTNRLDGSDRSRPAPRPGRSRAGSTDEPPTYSIGSKQAHSALAWYSGPMTSARSRASSMKTCADDLACHHLLAWLSRTPLGTPVEPDVYICSATSRAASIGTLEEARAAYRPDEPRTSRVRHHLRHLGRRRRPRRGRGAARARRLQGRDAVGEVGVHDQDFAPRCGGR